MDAETYVKLTAEANELAIPEQYLAGTVFNFERSASMARKVMAFELGADIEPAYIYRCERHTE